MQTYSYLLSLSLPLCPGRVASPDSILASASRRDCQGWRAGGEGKEGGGDPPGPTFSDHSRQPAVLLRALVSEWHCPVPPLAPSSCPPALAKTPMPPTPPLVGPQPCPHLCKQPVTKLSAAVPLEHSKRFPAGTLTGTCGSFSKAHEH